MFDTTEGVLIISRVVVIYVAVVILMWVGNGGIAFQVTF